MKKSLNRVLSTLLAIAIAAGLFLTAPPNASADALTSMLVLTTANYGDHTADGYTWVTDGNSGGTLTLTNFTLNTSAGHGIWFNSSVTGAITIVLVGDNSVTTTDFDSNGIHVYSATPLTIQGDGSLNVTSTDDDSYGLYARRDITITGSGSVTAVGGNSGIYLNSSGSTTSTISITGGNVNATGGVSGICARFSDVSITGSSNVNAVGTNPEGTYPGIGIYSERNNTYGGLVTIDTTGTVTATGGVRGISASQDVLIADGTVTASGSDKGIWAASGSVAISGGSVIATGTNNEGINAAEDVTIGAGAEVTATGNQKGISTGRDIIISGADTVVNATSTSTQEASTHLDLTAIRAGHDVLISGGSVTATASNQFTTGIAAGNNVDISGDAAANVNVTATAGSEGIFTINNITINTEGTVTATAIGKEGKGFFANQNITITDGTVNASQTGLSVGWGMVGRKIIVTGGIVTAGSKLIGIEVLEKIEITGGTVTANGGFTDLQSLTPGDSITIEAGATFNGINGGQKLSDLANTADIINYYTFMSNNFIHNNSYTISARFDATSVNVSNCTAFYPGESDGITKAKAPLVLPIPEGVLVKWGAKMARDSGAGALIDLSGSTGGLFEVVSGGLLDNSADSTNFPVFNMGANASVLVRPGGTVTDNTGADLGYLVEFAATSGTVDATYKEDDRLTESFPTGTRITGSGTVVLESSLSGKNYVWSGAGTNGETTKKIEITSLAADVNALVTVTDGGNGGVVYPPPGSRPFTNDPDDGDGGESGEPDEPEEPEEPEEPAEPQFPFDDVKDDDWFYDDAVWAWENGLLTGTSATKFSPFMSTTRGMLATVIYRLAGEPTATGTNTFTDVLDNYWYTDAITWAEANGVVKGYSSEIFAPDRNITREELVAMLWRYAGSPAVDATLEAATAFPDAGAVSGYAKEAFAWAISVGIVKGDDAGKLNPQSFATRAEVATVLRRYAEKVR
jgi:hypothetical protein